MRWKNLVSSLAALAVVGVTCAPAAAMSSVSIARHAGYFWSGGGEFTITPDDGAWLPYQPSAAAISDDSFQSFGIETNEYVLPPYHVYYEVNTVAIRGGAYTSPHPDPLDPRTAYLYTEFWNGELDGYDFDNNGDGGAAGNLDRQQSAEQLQQVIWFIEQEIAGVGPGSQAEIWLNQAEVANWQDIGDVRVLNVWRNSDFTGHAQDQLVVINNTRQNVEIVPLPAAAWSAVAMLPILAAGARRRRRR